MAYDGLVTNKISNELKNNIINYKIDKILQPNKNTIIIGLYKSGVNLSLLSCISANNYRFHLTTHTYKNPEIAPNFCMLLRKHLIGYKIKNIYTPTNLERIIFIDFENDDNPNKLMYKKLIIELMGKHSNIILANENNIIIDSLRHTYIEKHSQRDIYPTCRYILPQTSKLNLLDTKSPDEFYNVLSPFNCPLSTDITASFNGISNSFIESVILNTLEHTSVFDPSKEDIYLIYYKLLEIINSDNLCFNTKCQDYVLSLSETDNTPIYNLNYYLDDFYYKKELDEKFKQYKNNILYIVLNTKKKYTKRLENINKKLSACNDMDKFKLYGELIISNLYRISNNNSENITLENYYNNNSLINIPLNKKYSPSFNAKQYFKKYTKLKNSVNLLNNQKQETLSTLSYIDSVIFEIENSISLEDLISINEEITCIDTIFSNFKKNNTNMTRKKSNTKKQPSYFKPLLVEIDDYKIYIGRNNKENDYLTTKFADKNDLWFHVKDTPGSHVILKTHPNEIVPDNILYEVAKQAALHSKAKSSSSILVDYCLVSYVKKPNGSNPGFVIYKNNKSINIKI